MRIKVFFEGWHQNQKSPECLLLKGFDAYCGLLIIRLAEKEGFEPPERRRSTVFKTAAIDHSAISPGAKVIFFCF